MANAFLDWLNSSFKPEGKTWEYSQQQVDTGNEDWDWIMNVGGGQPTYNLVNEGLTSAPPEVYNRPDYRGLAPGDTLPVSPPVEAQVEVGMPQVLPPMLSGGAPTTGTTLSELIMRSALGQAPSSPGPRPALPGVQPPLEGTLEPRRPMLNQTRPALERPPLEGETVRKSLGGPSGTRPALPSSPAPTRPMWNPLGLTMQQEMELIRRGLSLSPGVRGRRMLSEGIDKGGQLLLDLFR